jgi:acyl carrier protein
MARNGPESVLGRFARPGWSALCTALDRARMKRDRPLHTLLAEQLGAQDGVDLTAIAHALEEEFGVALPDQQLARISSYGELLQLLRDVMAGDAEQMNEDELAACFVRARVVATGADGRVSLVRVGWLTPDLVTAVADDVRHSPTGTGLLVLVPDDLTEPELGILRQWLGGLISTHVRIDVRRAADPPAESMGPSATPGCDRLTQDDPDPADSKAAVRSYGSGTGLAASDDQQQLRCTQRRRSQQ